MLREPTRTKWWGTAGAPLIPRSVDSRPPWQVACRLRLRRAGGQGTHAGGQCARDRTPARGKNLNLIIAVARAGGGQKDRRRPSPRCAMVPSWHKIENKERAGSELGRGFEVKSPIGRRSSRDRSDRVKPRSLIVLVLPSLAAGPSIHLRSGSYAAGG